MLPMATTEKLTDPFTVKLEYDQKRKFFGLTAINGTTPSEVLRSMVEKYITEHEREYESMKSIFGDTSSSDKE